MSFEPTEETTTPRVAVAAKTTFTLNVTVPEGRDISITDGVRTKTWQTIPAGKQVQVAVTLTLEDVPA